MPTYPYIVLDAYPLGNAIIPLAKPGTTPTPSEACRQWMEDCQAAGTIFLVPAIAYYEEARELESRRATAKIARFEAFCFHPTRFIPLILDHLKAATVLWGQMRRSGLTTADRHALDGDVILAAQVLGLGLAPHEYRVATRNVTHLARLGLPADEWHRILP
jgi:hypothetical protein